MMSPETKEKVEARLERMSGQVAGIGRMVSDDRYCVDILNQIAAARAALAKAGSILLESHIRTCVAGAIESRDAKARDAKVAELVKLFDKQCRA